METILNLKGDNLKFAFYDISRILTIQVITQFLFVMNNSNITFFNVKFISTLIFLCIGVLSYWLVVRKLIDIYYDKNISEEKSI
tara:strand:+ start:1931 stop:2182 length:252 start_codon:yes stop_codon:yes gene_type:complete